MGIELKDGKWVVLRDGSGPYEVEIRTHPFLINGVPYMENGRIDADICTSGDAVAIVDPPKRFKLGKEYELRGGGIGVVLADDINDIYQLIGYTVTTAGKKACFWLKSGRCLLNLMESNYDLIPE